MPQIRVTPKTSDPVLHQDGKRVLDAAGETVEDSVHWRRREAEGEVEIAPASEAVSTRNPAKQR
ncbi:MAG: DUF2635 domain-containing protein [Rhodospirillales bacterium]|jgi:hypothetical protein